jgi:hypothetical protein
MVERSLSGSYPPRHIGELLLSRKSRQLASIRPQSRFAMMAFQEHFPTNGKEGGSRIWYDNDPCDPAPTVARPDYGAIWNRDTGSPKATVSSTAKSNIEYGGAGSHGCTLNEKEFKVGGEDGDAGGPHGRNIAERKGGRRLDLNWRQSVKPASAFSYSGRPFTNCYHRILQGLLVRARHQLRTTLLNGKANRIGGASK